MRILIAGKIDVKPEKRDDVLRGAVPFIQAALAEHGCVAYDWTADVNLPGRINVFEEWESEADLSVHLAGQPYRSMLGHLSGTGIVNAVTKKYRVDHCEPVYDPEGRPRADFFTAKPQT
jgi:quinol monooxygenase YgiN